MALQVQHPLSKVINGEKPRQLRHALPFPCKDAASDLWYVGCAFQTFPFIEVGHWLELWLEMISTFVSKFACFYQHQTENLAILILNSIGLTQTLSGDDKYNEKEAENNF